MTAGGIQPLAWDSNWLGFPVARLVAGPHDAAADVAAAVAGARAAGIRLLYCFLGPADAAANAAARAAGGQLVDVKLTFHLPLPVPGAAAAWPAGVVLAPVAALTPRLESLAWQSGAFSRFRRDARFGARAFEELYSGWLRQALTQGAVWAAVAGGEAVGLLAFGTRGGRASIELVAVAPAARHRRIGQCLVQAARQEAQRRGHAVLQVVTQAANEPAQRFYERCGFRLARTEHVYHLWL